MKTKVFVLIVSAVLASSAGYALTADPTIVNPSFEDGTDGSTLEFPAISGWYEAGIDDWRVQVTGGWWSEVPDTDEGLYWGKMTDHGAGISTYTDGAAAYDTIYYYVITAVDTSDNESGNSNEEAIILYEGDLTFNGSVDTDDIAELGIGWLNPYDMTTFQKLASDWLKTQP